MKYIDCGCGKIPWISILAILSISLTVNLPGLAISPIMGKLDEVFTDVTELEIQLLTVLPNLVTIPFILFSGKLCTPKNQMFILGAGLVIYTLTGVLYFFADRMAELIVLSCMLGVGCGLIIPLAASMISEYTVGKARTKILGMKSGVSNFMVIFATLFVGWIAAYNWHAAFTVYMIPLIPLCLMPFMSRRYIDGHRIDAPGEFVAPAREPARPSDKDIAQARSTGKPAGPNFHFQGKLSLILLAGLMSLYFMATYGTEVVSYYLPFTMKDYHLTTGDVGVATAMYFASATLSGFILPKAIKLCREWTMEIALVLVIFGLFFVGVFHAYWTYIVGIFIMGLGYGVIQPLIYDKTSYVAPNAAKQNAYFSYLLTCNYIGISLVPFIIGAARRLFNSHSDNFSFIFNGFVLLVVLLIAIWKRRSFVIAADADSYENQPSTLGRVSPQTPEK